MRVYYGTARFSTTELCSEASEGSGTLSSRPKDSPNMTFKTILHFSDKDFSKCIYNK